MTTHIICCGVSVLDRVWPVDALPTGGGKYHARDYLELGGGMAANAAVTAARLGAQAAYWGRGGEDSAGQMMRQEMADFGVKVNNFRLCAGARSSVSAILVAKDGERMIVNFSDAGMPTDATWLPLEDVSACAAVLADVRWVEGAQLLYMKARSLGIPTVIDAEKADASAFATLLPLVDHAIFSKPGLCSFAGDTALDDDASRIAALEKVRMLGCRMAAVTLGAQGTIWLDDAGLHRQAAFTVNVADTTGAGDAFHGAYTLAIGEGQTISQAMRFASAVSALKCTRRGGRAGLPSCAEVNLFLAERAALTQG